MSKYIIACMPIDGTIVCKCIKPSNWDELTSDQKLEYFADNYKETKDIHNDGITHNWYDYIDPDVDFNEEEV